MFIYVRMNDTRLLMVQGVDPGGTRGHVPPTFYQGGQNNSVSPDFEFHIWRKNKNKEYTLHAAISFR